MKRNLKVGDLVAATATATCAATRRRRAACAANAYYYARRDGKLGIVVKETPHGDVIWIRWFGLAQYEDAYEYYNDLEFFTRLSK